MKRLLKSWVGSKHLRESVKKVMSKDSEVNEDEFTFPDPDAGFEQAAINVAWRSEMKRLGLRITHSKAMQRFLYRFRNIFPQAFSPSKLILGWTIGGYNPWNPFQALSACSNFSSLPKEEQKRLLTVVLPEMIKIFGRRGHCTDAEMDALHVYADYTADPNDPNVSLVEFAAKVAVNQRRATLLSHVEQARIDNEIRKKANAVNKARAVLGGTMVDAYKIRLRIDTTVLPKGTKDVMRGMLEALKVPLKKYCGDGPDLDGNSKVKISAVAMRDLLRQQVLLVVEGEGGAGGGEEEYDDDFEDDDDL